MKSSILVLSLILFSCSGCLKPNPSFDPAKYVDQYMDEKGVLTQEDLNSKGTLEAVDNYLDGLNLNTQVDLNGYVTKNDLESYVTKTNLDEKGYLTQTDLNGKDYVTQADLAGKGFLTQADIRGESVVVPNAYQPGTRLQLKSGRTSDGARVFMGWYDSALEIDCDFFSTVQGAFCIPLNIPPGIGNMTFPRVFKTDLFSDINCELPIFEFRDLSVAAPGIMTKESRYGFDWDEDNPQRISKAYTLSECAQGVYLYTKVDRVVCQRHATQICETTVYKTGTPMMLAFSEIFVKLDVVLESAGN